jgi:hypothetical protein
MGGVPVRWYTTHQQSVDDITNSLRIIPGHTLASISLVTFAVACTTPQRCPIDIVINIAARAARGRVWWQGGAGRRGGREGG